MAYFTVSLAFTHHNKMVWPSASIVISWKWGCPCLLNLISQPYFGLMLLSHVFIINRLPSSVLEDVLPYFKLFNKGPDYSLFRSFGCSCFLLLRPYSVHKLMFRSKRCIFLGYSTNQSGYRCLDPVSRKVYVSRHVVFDESQFPAKEDVLSSPTPSDLVSYVPFPALFSFASPTSQQISNISIDDS
jgi:hypothetical protein